MSAPLSVTTTSGQVPTSTQQVCGTVYRQRGCTCERSKTGALSRGGLSSLNCRIVALSHCRPVVQGSVICELGENVWHGSTDTASTFAKRRSSAAEGTWTTKATKVTQRQCDKATEGPQGNTTYQDCHRQSVWFYAKLRLCTVKRAPSQICDRAPSSASLRARERILL